MKKDFQQDFNHLNKEVEAEEEVISAATEIFMVVKDKLTKNFKEDLLKNNLWEEEVATNLEEEI